MHRRLTEEEVQVGLNRTEGWALEENGKWIARKYRFASFMDGIGFVDEVARIAEELNHHPMISIDYRLVTLRLTSWNAGGLTELDFTSARRYDEAYAGFRK
ncbi:4a-hydroxytetrahydrobiopterin dehydratase [Paenibacillus naphthalenovorans]|uniref:Putative pterin-4-alpha-carbinolamine dehydratase n=1 Tax=Paenibacillus naphthalenovorans TaxID=162209 RepID=A0A0U2WB90_9BACL|nr:4a-hydroxytetrahydrobiopterin dehydratase [Paenibacillus naphthalenovorans]ALS24733.1 pterin-4-alpha-carbinolamine dehydratase [Paenibacillus naphthalenovorans]GCL73937.1 4a-hydroxytetrahydrobiopterin dehydratase [Paenibacillus naphthalenovorans]SDJ06921.1 4a-hydroxytetrahydrobiopterin dehydratase [Paenibacillus naphthalenovorans]